MDVGLEVDAVENLVDADDEQVVGGPLEDGEVVAGRDDDVVVCRDLPANPVDEVELARHGRTPTLYRPDDPNGSNGWV